MKREIIPLFQLEQQLQDFLCCEIRMFSILTLNATLIDKITHINAHQLSQSSMTSNSNKLGCHITFSAAMETLSEVIYFFIAFFRVRRFGLPRKMDVKKRMTCGFTCWYLLVQANEVTTLPMHAST